MMSNMNRSCLFQYITLKISGAGVSCVGRSDLAIPHVRQLAPALSLCEEGSALASKYTTAGDVESVALTAQAKATVSPSLRTLPSCRL